MEKEVEKLFLLALQVQMWIPQTGFMELLLKISQFSIMGQIPFDCLV
jgi:hypothetical protein